MLEFRAKAIDFGAWLDRNVGKVGYLIGTRGHLCTAELIKEKRANFPTYQLTIDKYAAQWIGKVVADCMGVYEMFMSGGEWDRPLTSWRYGDVSTGSVYALVLSEGLRNGQISTLPKDLPYPIAVGFTGHVGFYYNGYVYHSSGHAFGLEKTELNYTGHQSHPWAYWYYLPWLDYGGDIMLQKGDKGLAVTYWQKSLLKWNPAALPRFGADADFGGETETWTKNFQVAVGLPQTGIVDALTYGHMANILMSISSGVSQAELDAEKAKTTAALEQVASLSSDLDAANGQLATATNDLIRVTDERDEYLSYLHDLASNKRKTDTILSQF